MKLKKRTVWMSDEDWAYCKSLHKSAGAVVRHMIAYDRRAMAMVRSLCDGTPHLQKAVHEVLYPKAVVDPGRFADGTPKVYGQCIDSPSLWERFKNWYKCREFVKLRDSRNRYKACERGNDG